jgi:hypothetical protein
MRIEIQRMMNSNKRSVNMKRLLPLSQKPEESLLKTFKVDMETKPSFKEEKSVLRLLLPLKQQSLPKSIS